MTVGTLGRLARSITGNRHVPDPMFGGRTTDGINPSVSQKDIAARVADLQRQLDVSETIVRDLLSIAGTDIVIIADDSGSMSSVSDATNVMAPRTRWMELKDTLLDLVEMLLLVDHADGFTLKFLNDPLYYQVASRAAVEKIFQSAKPRGGTPLAKNLTEVFTGAWLAKDKQRETKDVIVLCATDGEPGDITFSGLQTLLRNRPKAPFPYFVTFLMCTEEDDVVAKYDECIDPIPGCDVIDDYLSERKQVQKYKKSQSFSRARWLAKATLAGKMPKYDKMDEQGGGCCNVM